MASEPKTLGKYVVKGKIGKGAMGEVYRGHDPVLDRDVAIKIIADTLDADPELVERFKREAKFAASLNHPNIVTVFDFVEDEGHLYMVMELLEGQDLKELIKSGAPLTVEQILSVMEQIADGLGFAHEKGIIHRDLKPANIHISKKGQVKILDFGLVHEASSDMTKSGQVMGTPNYMSPEQVQGLKVDPRSDIFSLGAVFYELLTRKKPFSADSIHATMFKVVQGDREPLDKYTHLPRPLVNMVDRALDKEPEGRFENAQALREHLRVLRKEVASGHGADATMTSRADATVLTPTSEPGSHPSTPPRSSARSVGLQNRSTSPAASGSASRGTVRRRELGTTSMGAAAASGSPTALYAVIALALLAVGVAAYFMTRSETSSDRDVEALSNALVESQEQLMLASLEQGSFEDALSRAEELLETNPTNPTAARVRDEAEAALAQIDDGVAEAREALAAGDTARAADALARVLELDPAHPLGAELSDQLNQHFQSRAEQARNQMEAARSAASRAGAASRPEFAEADRLREQASEEFNRAEYTNAAQRYQEARQAYVRATSAHEQALAQERAQAAQQAEATRERTTALRAELRDAEDTWNRLRQQPADAGIERQPSYQRALAEEGVAERLAAAEDYEGAAQAYRNAVDYLQRAQTELRQAQRAARGREQTARQAAAATTTPPTSVPTSSAPSPAQEEAAIRQVLANYERAIETKNLALFRQVKPNLSGEEEERLSAAFSSTDSHEVELSVETITIEGDTAQVRAARSDVITIRGRTQNGNTRSQSFTLQKMGGEWVIVELGQ